MNFTGIGVAIPNARFDAFAMLDTVLICENQTAYINFNYKKYI
jgi:hypothetical protein